VTSTTTTASTRPVVLTKDHLIAQTLPVGAGLDLPVGVVTETLAILGLRGSGKTNTATVIALDALHAAFAEVVAQAEADDPKALQKRIAELERQLASQPAAATGASDAELREAWRRGVLQGRLEQDRLMRRHLAEIEGAVDQITAAGARVNTVLDTLDAESPDIGPDASIEYVDETTLRRIAPTLMGDQVRPSTVPVEITGHDMVRGVPVRFDADVPVDSATARELSRSLGRPDLSASVRPPADHAARAALGSTPGRMLDAMAILEALGIPEPSRVNVAGWVGISANTGTFRNYLSELRSAGAIEDRPGLKLALTAKGRRIGQVPPLLPTLRELHDAWASKLGGKTAKSCASSRRRTRAPSRAPHSRRRWGSMPLPALSATTYPSSGRPACSSM